MTQIAAPRCLRGGRIFWPSNPQPYGRMRQVLIISFARSACLEHVAVHGAAGPIGACLPKIPQTAPPVREHKSRPKGIQTALA